MNPIERVLGESGEAALARLLPRLRAYVEHESPSRDYERCAALAQRVASDIVELGGSAQLIDAPPLGMHVLARFGPETGQPLLVMGHLDTVHPVGTLERQPFTIDPASGRVSGPGVYDMKSGVVLMLEALGGLLRSGRLRRAVHVLITCDEEIGSHTSRAIIEDEARQAQLVLVPEPSLPGGKVKTSRKGVATYAMTARGRAAHAGIEPERGINAIAELAHQIISLDAIANPATGSTVSVGTIKGGTATNTIPAEASAAVDVRYSSAAEAGRVHAALMQRTPTIGGASVEVVQTEARPPLERTEKVIALYQQARALAAELEFDLGEGSTGGGSDGCLSAAVGTPTLDGLGAQGGGAHAIDEHVLLADLPLRLAFYMLLLERL